MSFAAHKLSYPLASSVGSSVSTCAASEDSCESLASSTVVTECGATLAEDLARTEALRLRLSGSLDALVAENEAKMEAFRARSAVQNGISNRKPSVSAGTSTKFSRTLAEDFARTEALRSRLAGGCDVLVAENEAKMEAFRARLALQRESSFVTPDEDALGLDELRTAELRYRMASRRLEAVMQDFDMNF